MTEEVGSAPDPFVSTTNRIVLKAPFHRQRGPRVTFVKEPPAAKPEPARRPAKIACMLALAHHIEDAIRRGVVADRAAVARELGFTRARITYLLDLLLLSPTLQERLLLLEAVDGVEPFYERQLRPVVKERRWWMQHLAPTVTTPRRGRRGASCSP